jgi:hypothetical protein
MIRDIEDDLVAVSWAKWYGAYNDRLGSVSKTHIVSGDGDTTLCGKQVPSEAEAEGEWGGSIFSADCKRCKNKMWEKAYV